MFVFVLKTDGLIHRNKGGFVLHMMYVLDKKGFSGNGPGNNPFEKNCIHRMIYIKVAAVVVFGPILTDINLIRTI